MFPGKEGELHVRQEEMLVTLLGSADQPDAIRPDNPEFLAASQRAVNALMAKHKPRFVRGLPAGETLLVKAGFTRPGTSRHEYMWLEVLRWEGQTLKGVLQNDPQDVPGLKRGAAVELDESAVLDYLVRRPDGSEEGNETGRALGHR